MISWLLHAFRHGMMTQNAVSTGWRPFHSLHKEIDMSGIRIPAEQRYAAGAADVAVRATLCFVLLAFVSLAVHAQVSMRIRGTITGVQGDVLSVKTRESKDMQLRMNEKTVVVASKTMKLEDLKAGDYAGSTTQKRPDGTLVAVEVHALPPTAKPGHTPWDLEPGSMMTNGTVGTVGKATSGQQLTLDYQGGSQTIVVPPGTPIVTNTPADRSALRTGEYVFTSAAVAADGTMTVQRIQVSRDGVKPPQ
jgi:hypothetical protein